MNISERTVVLSAYLTGNADLDWPWIPALYDFAVKSAQEQYRTERVLVGEIKRSINLSIPRREQYVAHVCTQCRSFLSSPHEHITEEVAIPAEAFYDIMFLVKMLDAA